MRAIVYITATHLCHCSAKAVVDNTEMNGCVCVPRDLINKNVSRPDLAQGPVVCQPLVCRLCTEILAVVIDSVLEDTSGSGDPVYVEWDEK